MALIEKKTIVKTEIDYDKLAKAIAKANNTAIDYDKLADTINVAISQSLSEEKSDEKFEKKLKNFEWRRAVGLKEYPYNSKWLKKKLIDFLNLFIFFKAVICYKKGYVKDARITFAFMTMICVYIFFVLELAFYLIVIGHILNEGKNILHIKYLLFDGSLLFFGRMMRVIRLEIDHIQDNERINMIFSSLMAFIAALFTTLAFLKG